MSGRSIFVHARSTTGSTCLSARGTRASNSVTNRRGGIRWPIISGGVPVLWCVLSLEQTTQITDTFPQDFPMSWKCKPFLNEMSLSHFEQSTALIPNH